MLRGLRRKNSGQMNFLRQIPAMSTLFVIATALVFLLFAGTSEAADYYVSPTGAATWANCSGTTPLNGTSACSWQTAMASAVADDIVYFRGGTYNVGTIGSQRDYANMRPSNSGTAGNPITFIAYSGETPVITGTVINGSVAAYFGCSYNNYITWDGFAATLQVYSGSYETQTWGAWGSTYCTIKNSNFTGVNVGSRVYNTSFVRIVGSTYSTIENNYFHDLIGTTGAVNTAGIWLFEGDYTTIRNNTFYNTKGAVYGKDDVSSADIYNNFVYNPTLDDVQGIYINRNAGGTTVGFNIYQNVMVGCSIELVGVGGIVNNSKIYNNTIYNTNGNEGVSISSGVSNVEIFNNIIYGPSPLLRYYTASTYSYANNNSFYRSSSFVWNLNWTTNYTSIASWTAATGFDANSITSNPLFVNTGGASAADYKLQANSPARTSGRGGSYATVMGAYITGDEIIGYDPDAPRVEITSPASSTVTTTDTSITISGTATDTQGIVSVTCNNDRGGNCTCAGTTNWTCSNIPLQSGQNIITVTATDGDNKTGIDAITVTVLTGGGDTPPPSSGSGGDSSASGGSGCGFVKDDGEGLSFILMLIITLTSIAIARRFSNRFSYNL